MIEVDGSQGEGGGQILRTSAALAVLTGIDLKVSNIRAGRSRPGLAAQHLAALRGVASICQGELEGASIGSKEVVLRPQGVRGGDHVIDVGTAGSITLVAQAALLALVICEDGFDLTITGGTDVPMAPSITYLELVILPQLRKMGYDIEVQEMRRGFFPPGGGMVRLTGKGCRHLRPLILDHKGPLERIDGVAFAQNLPERVAQRMSMETKRLLVDHQPVSIKVENAQGLSTGAGIVLRANYGNTVLGASALGERGVSSEIVAGRAVSILRREMSSGTLDAHAADQLLPYMALGEGESVFTVGEVSSHLATQMDLLPLFLPVKFEKVTDRTTRLTVLSNRT